MDLFYRMSVIATLGLALGCSLDRPGVNLQADSDASTDVPDAAPNRPDADPNQPDAAPPPDAPPGFDCTIWTPRPTAYFDPCAIPSPSAALNIQMAGTWVYNTTTGQLLQPGGSPAPQQPSNDTFTQPGGVMARIISVDSFTLDSNATLRAIGDFPLIVASWDTITINSTIDVGSKRDEFPEIGAGANANCGGDAPQVGTDQDTGGGGHGGAGGGGGGYGDAGGDGGDGRGNGITSGIGGTAISGGVPEFVRGGCAGAAGGRGSPAGAVSAPGSPGGPSGGAIQLTARNEAVITGTLSAGGGGGLLGVQGSSAGAGRGGGGGGGGGSGGFIGIEAPIVTISGGLYAHGGGGGEGNRENVAGMPGDDAPVGMGFGAGGSGAQGRAGDGGDGYPTTGTMTGQDEDTGGGGGGGAGLIVVRSTSMLMLNQDNSSPDAIINP